MTLNSALTLITLMSFGGYLATNKRPYKYTFKTSPDNKIPFIAVFVIPYILLFPYLIWAYIALDGLQLQRFLVAVSVANFLATIFWFAVPNGVKRERIKTKGILHDVMNLIYQYDGDTNGFPSGHVFLSLISTYFLFITTANPIYLGVGFLIALSAVFTKQHYVVDILGGIIFGICAVLISLAI